MDEDEDDDPYPLVRRWDPNGWWEWVETEPDACPNGHPWDKPHTMQRGYIPCSLHDGHRTWLCLTSGCGLEMLNPPHEGDLDWA